MASEFLIIKGNRHFRTGQLVEGKVIKGELLIEGKTIKDDSFVMLNEVLTLKDEERVKQIVREILKKFLYRQYTRSAFLLQQ